MKSAKKWAAHKEGLRRGIDEVTIMISCKIFEEQASSVVHVSEHFKCGWSSLGEKKEETSQRFSGQDWSRELPRAE